jgi:lysophospholipase L1-like esterase
MLGGPSVPHIAAGTPFRVNSTASNSTYDQNTGGTGEGIAFGTAAQAFEVYLIAAPGTFRFQFTDVATGARSYYDWTSPGGYTPRYVKFDMGSPGSRIVEAYGVGYAWGGVVVATTERLWSPSSVLSRPTMLAFGDSYVQDYWPSPVTSRGGLFPTLADITGMQLIKSGVGGQGAVKADPTYNKTFLDRANSGDFAKSGPVDLIYLYASINDWNQSTTALKANWKAVFQRAMADNPNAIIIGLTGFMAPGFTVDSAHNTAFAAAFQEVADSRRMRLIDLYNDPSPLFTVGAQLNANMHTDNIHLKLSTAGLGVNYAAPRMAAGIVGACRSIVSAQ